MSFSYTLQQNGTDEDDVRGVRPAAAAAAAAAAEQVNHLLSTTGMCWSSGAMPDIALMAGVKKHNRSEVLGMTVGWGT